jgi:hypothetical protein
MDGEGIDGGDGGNTDAPPPTTTSADGPARMVAADKLACGWVFPPPRAFDHLKLTAFLRAVAPRVARVKGVFRIAGSADYFVPTLAPCPDGGGGGGGGAVIDLEPICYRGDSLAEVILPHALPAAGNLGGSSSSSDRKNDAAGAAAAAAVAAAMAGDWSPLESLLIETLAS